MQSGFFQFPVSFADPAQNFRQVDEHLGPAAFDFLVMPELCSSGYFHPTRDALYARSECAREGITVQHMQALSADKQATLVFGIAERDGDDVYNTAVAVSCGRWLGKQRKCHLTRLERDLFSAGDTLACLDDGRCRFGILICFDLWMPEAARLLTRQGAQLLCCPANYGGPQTTQLARIRAMENATPLICANRSGVEQHAATAVRFRGESQIVDAAGEVLAIAASETALGLVTLDPARHRQKSAPMCDDLMQEAGRYRLSGPGRGQDPRRATIR